MSRVALRALALTLGLLTLPGVVRSQEPGDDPRDPALPGLGAALERAFAAKVLQGLPAEQSFRVEGQARSVLMMIMIRPRAGGTLKMSAAAFLPGGKVSIEEHDLRAGRFVEAERKLQPLSGSVDGAGPTRHWRGVVQGEALAMQVGEDQHGDIPLRPGTLPLPVVLFVLPSIGEQLDALALLPFECPVLVDVDAVPRGTLRLERAPADQAPREGAAAGERAFLLTHPTLGEAQVYVSQTRVVAVHTFNGTWLRSIPQGEAKRLALASMRGQVAAAEEDLAEAELEANEVVALGSLKSLAAAQAMLREADRDANGVLDYAADLQVLGALSLIDPALAGGVKQGYRFELCRSTGAPEFRWMAIASPSTPGVSGRRHFAVNQEGVIFWGPGPFALDPDECQIKGGQPVGR